MTIENLGKFLENYKKLNSSKKLEDNSLLGENCDVNFKKAAKWNNAVLASDRDADPNFVVTGKYIVSKLDDSKDSILQLDEFKDYFTQKGFFGKEYISDSQLEELFDLISAIDGTEGVSVDDLDYLIGLDKTKNGITETAIKNFLLTIKEFSKTQDDSSSSSSDTSSSDTSSSGTSSASSSSSGSSTDAQEETEADKRARERKEAQEAKKKEEQEAQEAKEAAKKERAEKFKGKAVENYDALNSSSTALKDLSVIDGNVDFTRLMKKGINGSSLMDSDKYGKKDGEVTADEIFAYYGADGEMTKEQFRKFFGLGSSDPAQVDELFSIISSLDGKDKVTVDELQYVMDFSDDGNFTSEDVKLFLNEIKSQLGKTGESESKEETAEAQTDSASAQESTQESNDVSGAQEQNAQEISTTTSSSQNEAEGENGTSETSSQEAFLSAEVAHIQEGETPIGLMKKVSGADGFNKEDYKALIEMNIKMGNVTQEQVQMTDSQKEKYGVDYMLRPGMNLKIYSQSQIEEFKKTGNVKESVVKNFKKEDYENKDGTSTRILTNKYGEFQSAVFYGSDYSLTVDLLGYVSKYSKDSTQKYSLIKEESGKTRTIGYYVSDVGSVKPNISKTSALYNELSSDKYDEKCPVLSFEDYYCYQGVLYDKEGNKVELESLTLMEAS